MTIRVTSLALLVALAAFAWSAHALLSNATTPSHVPVAFWAWQAHTPSPAAVSRTVAATGARAIYLRAGQFDFDGERVTRIRAVAGAMPAGVELHLVYNATGDLLDGFERVCPDAFTGAFRAALDTDLDRAARDGAIVAGVQFDIDAPTRLLPHYRELLAAARAAMPEGLALSITGLPTWMESPELAPVLAVVDFWAPQFYGVAIPERVDVAAAIATPARVGRDVARAEALGRPYFAGLASYGYAIHYARDGRLLGVRGDLDPAAVARVVNLESADERAYGDDPSGEWRRLYRASARCSIDGLAIESGEWLVVDLPSAGWLRSCVRAVRAHAGANLRGICVFRLPTEDDRTALTIDEVRAALEDHAGELAPAVTARRDGDAVVVDVTNAGTRGPRPGPGALVVDVPVPAGGVRLVELGGFASADLLAPDGAGAFRPCSARRAGLVRLVATSWRPGEALSARISFIGDAPQSLEVRLASQPLDEPRWSARCGVEVVAR